MKKLFWIWVSFWILATAPTFAQAPPINPTPNLGLNRPEYIPGTWGESFDQNWVKLDSTGITLNLTCTNGQVPVWSGTGFTACGSTIAGDFSANISFQGDITPPQITANTDNYNPTGLSTASTLRLSTDASRNLTGIVGGADGRLLLVHNVGAFNLVLINDATSTAANRFLINANITLAPNQGLILQYDATTLRWRAASGISGGGGGQAADNDLTALAGLSGTGFAVRTGPDTWAQRQLTGAAGNITVTTNPAGVAGDPVIDLGATAVQTDQSNTWTTGDQNMGAAASFTPPAAPGATPSAGRFAYDSTSTTFRGGTAAGSKTFAFTDQIQPLDPDLTQIAAIPGAANTYIIHNGTNWVGKVRGPCSGANQAVNYDNVTQIEGCVTISGSISGGTVNNFPIYATASTLTPSIMSQTAGVVHVGGGLEVNCTTAGSDCININTAAYAGHVPYDLPILYGGASASIPVTVGARTSGNVVKWDANGALIAGGAAGTGDVTLAGPNTLTNTTMDEASGNVFKVTKSIQVELFGPTTDNTTGTGLFYYRIPVSLNGTNLVGIQANVVTPGTGGLVNVQVTRCAAAASGAVCSGTTAGMLSTSLSVDPGENSSSNAATAAVINTANDDVSTGQILQFTVLNIHTTTPAKGLIVNLDFKLP